MFLQGRRELGEGAEERGFGLLGVIGADCADGSFVALRHVGVGVPEPFDGAAALNERHGDFAFEEGCFVFRGTASHFVEIQLALQAGFLNEHSFAGLLGGEGVPQNLVVEPPGVVGSEVDGSAPERGREAVLNATLILADGDELLGTCGTNGVAHREGPVREGLLREQKIVVEAERVGPGVHASGGELFLTRKRDHACDGAGSDVPQRGELGAVGIALSQPRVPRREFDGIAVGARPPKVLREAGFVDEIPGKVGDIVEAGDDRRDQSLLAADGLGIEEGIGASEHIGEEGEEIELHRQAVFAGGH